MLLSFHESWHMHQADLDNRQVVLYSDGACSGNPGNGGYGTVLLYKKDGEVHRKELSGGYLLTTNNRMELLGVIRGLEALKRKSAVSIYTDSKYIVDAITKNWLVSWKNKGWKNAQKKPVKNRDLWEKLDALIHFHEAQFHWVKGHAGLEENERCDTLAVEASKGELEEDNGYKGDE